MKWWEILGVITSIIFLIKFFYLAINIFDANNTLSQSLVFLLSSIFSVLMIVILIEYQNQKEIGKIKDFLNLDDLENRRNKMVKNRRGVIDPRILWIILALIILFLLFKSLTS